MYTNMYTIHGTSQVEEWIEEYHEELPTDSPSKAFKETLKLVMYNNIFEFGERFYEKLSGCAMGLPAACTYAIKYHTYQERNTLIPKYKKMYYFVKDLLTTCSVSGHLLTTQMP